MRCICRNLNKDDLFKAKISGGTLGKCALDILREKCGQNFYVRLCWLEYASLSESYRNEMLKQEPLSNGLGIDSRDISAELEPLQFACANEIFSTGHLQFLQIMNTGTFTLSRELCQNLKILKLVHVSLTDEDLEVLFNQARGLKGLSMKGVGKDGTTGKCLENVSTQFECIRITGCTFEKAHVEKFLFRQFQLYALRIDRDCDLNYVDLNNFPKLNSLSVNALEGSITNWHKLDKLESFGISEQPDLSLLQRMSKVDSMNKLSFRGPWPESDVLNVLADFQNLHCLKVSLTAVHNCSPLAIERFQQMVVPKLKRISIDVFCNDLQFFCESILPHATNLEELSLKNNCSRTQIGFL